MEDEESLEVVTIQVLKSENSHYPFLIFRFEKMKGQKTKVRAFIGLLFLTLPKFQSPPRFTSPKIFPTVREGSIASKFSGHIHQVNVHLLGPKCILVIPP